MKKKIIGTLLTIIASILFGSYITKNTVNTVDIGIPVLNIDNISSINSLHDILAKSNRKYSYIVGATSDYEKLFTFIKDNSLPYLIIDHNLWDSKFILDNQPHLKIFDLREGGDIPASIDPNIYYIIAKRDYKQAIENQYELAKQRLLERGVKNPGILLVTSTDSNRSIFTDFFNYKGNITIEKSIQIYPDTIDAYLYVESYIPNYRPDIVLVDQLDIAIGLIKWYRLLPAGNQPIFIVISNTDFDYPNIDILIIDDGLESLTNFIDYVVKDIVVRKNYQKAIFQNNIKLKLISHLK